MAVNLNKPHRWKSDIAESVKAYNEWFLASAPEAFRKQRESAADQVSVAISETDNLTRIDATILEDHPEILLPLRMATNPPLARDRLIGLSGTTRSMVQRMEKVGYLSGSNPRESG